MRVCILIATRNHYNQRGIGQEFWQMILISRRTFWTTFLVPNKPRFDTNEYILTLAYRVQGRANQLAQKAPSAPLPEKHKLEKHLGRANKAEGRSSRRHFSLSLSPRDDPNKLLLAIFGEQCIVYTQGVHD